MKISIVSLVFIAGMGASSLASAQEQAPAPVHDTGATTDSGAQPQGANTRSSVHTHDGFFLGLQLPLGFQQNTMVDETTITGTGTGFNAQVGGVVSPNLIVYGEISFASVGAPKMKVRNNSATADDMQVTDRGLGAGATYYIMPWNVYVGGSVLLSRFDMAFKDSDGDVVAHTESDLGIGAAARVGKEFWVSDNWALGLGLQARFATMKFLGEQMTTGTYGLTFNGTYN